MRLLLDECTGSRTLQRALNSAGHDTIRSIDTLGGAAADDAIVAFAANDDRVIVTHNCADFIEEAQANPKHAGILLVYRDNDSRRDMNASAVVRAVANVEAQHPNGLRGKLLVLNQYNWRTPRSAP